ncbi:MAG: PAS domain S-box protein [Chlorobiaceae bacterium]|nr:PAS domain S-box protein [Chlorobiaceae bacterium]
MERSGKILECNRSLAALFGRTVEETLNVNMYEIMPPEMGEVRKVHAEKVFTTGERLFFEDEHLGRYFRHSVYPVSGEDGNVYCIFIVAQDITDLKKAENELKMVEKTAKNRKIFSDALIEAIPGAFYMFDALGLFVIWNDYERDVVVGKPDSEMPSSAAIDTIHPDDRLLVEKLMATVLADGGEKTLEARVMIHGGPGFRWFQISGKRIIIDEIPFIIGIGIDIDDRKNADITTLRKSEERFRKLFDENSLINLLLDPETGKIMDANRAAADFYGWSIGELRNSCMNEINLLAEKESRVVFNKARSGEKKVFRCRHRTADKTSRDVEVHTNILDIDGLELLHLSLYDITERLLAEEKLKKLSIAIEQGPNVVMITDPAGNIEYTNPMFTRVTGYTFEEVEGKNPRILQSGMTQEEVYERLWKTIRSGTLWHGEFQNRKKNGELYWENAFIAPLRNNIGAITNFVSVKEDITEKKKLWTELVAAKEKAEESDQLKTAFLANMSHEIRTPMNGIMGLTELLKEPDLSETEQQEYIDLIQQSGERMMALINDLLDISLLDAKKTTLNIAETSVNAILQKLNAFFLPQARMKMLDLYLYAGLADEESIILTDARKLEQIVTNLVQNALKFTSHGYIDFGYRKTQGNLEFYVADTGIGISSEIKDRIFERFMQADNSLSRNQEGAGLGLSIVKGFVELLGGDIHVESNEKRGSRFIFTLPYKRPLHETARADAIQANK